MIKSTAIILHQFVIVSLQRKFRHERYLGHVEKAVGYLPVKQM